MESLSDSICVKLGTSVAKYNTGIESLPDSIPGDQTRQQLAGVPAAPQLWIDKRAFAGYNMVKGFYSMASKIPI